MIIEIALGIVLAVLILAFLPDLLGMSIILIAVVLLVAVGGIILYVGGTLVYDIGTLFYYLVSNFASFHLVIALVVVAIVFVLLRSSKNAPTNAMRQEIKRRQALGDDTVELEISLEQMDPTKEKSVRRRRWELGYTDKPDDT